MTPQTLTKNGEYAYSYSRCVLGEPTPAPAYYMRCVRNGQ